MNQNTTFKIKAVHIFYLINILLLFLLSSLDSASSNGSAIAGFLFMFYPLLAILLLLGIKVQSFQHTFSTNKLYQLREAIGSGIIILLINLLYLLPFILIFTLLYLSLFATTYETFTLFSPILNTVTFIIILLNFILIYPSLLITYIKTETTSKLLSPLQVIECIKKVAFWKLCLQGIYLAIEIGIISFVTFAAFAVAISV